MVSTYMSQSYVCMIWAAGVRFQRNFSTKNTTVRVLWLFFVQQFWRHESQRLDVMKDHIHITSILDLIHGTIFHGTLHPCEWVGVFAQLTNTIG